MRLNSRHSRWQRDALPLSYARMLQTIRGARIILVALNIASIG